MRIKPAIQDVIMFRKRYLLQLLILLAIVLLASGCEKDGHIRIINRTDYPVYAGAFGVLHTLPGNSDLKIFVRTGRQSPFDSNVGTYVTLDLVGETYQIWDAYLERYVDSTYVWVNAGKTTNVFVNANRACIKVVNNSQWWIKKIFIQTHTPSGITTKEHSVYLAPGEDWFLQQNPSTATFTYAYIVQVMFENDTVLTYGNNQNYLYLGDRFLVDVQHPVK